MNTAQELLGDLQSRGVMVWLDSQLLRYRAPAGVMTPHLLDVMRQHKPEIVALLSSSKPKNSIKLDIQPIENAKGALRADDSKVLARGDDTKRVTPLVVRFELDGCQAVCIDPYSQTVEEAIEELQARFPERVGKVWHQGALVKTG